MVNVGLAYTVTATCDAGIVPVIAISSNEAASSPGSGNTSPDWQMADAHDVLLRAERSGTINSDRIYSITLTAKDSAGGQGNGTVTVMVPHDQGN
jgi:hypothetical protein